MEDYSSDTNADKFRSPGGRLRARNRDVHYHPDSAYTEELDEESWTRDNESSPLMKNGSPHLDQHPNPSEQKHPSAPEASHGRVTKGVDSYVYDSEGGGGDRDERNIHVNPEMSWDHHLVRRCARSEFIVPGSSWNDRDFQALPQVKSAESRLASTTYSKHFSSAAVTKQIQRNNSILRPHNISAYLAVEVVAQLTRGNAFDKFWAAAGDLEEYIRRVIWPQIMRLDAERLRAGLNSQVVALEKLVPPSFAAGFNTQRFWGYGVYMALRFPPGSHPFTTPIVRNAIAHFRRCISDGRDPWGDNITKISTQMALAATWAGYHISHHLITCNVYDIAEDKVQQQRQQLDTLVWMATGYNGLVKDLFEEVITAKGNIALDLTWDEMSEEVQQMQWDRFVGACHRVDYNSSSLPLPLCKPSAVLSEMQSQMSRPAREWNDRIVDYGMILSKRSAKKVVKINEWLLNFLRGTPQKDEDARDDTYFSHLLSLINRVKEHRGESGPESSADNRLRNESPPSVADALESSDFSEYLDSPSSSLEEIRADIADLKTGLKGWESTLGEQLQQEFKENRTATEAIVHRALENFASTLLEAIEPALRQAIDLTLRTRLEAASNAAAESIKEGSAAQTAEIAGLIQGQNLVAVESDRSIVATLTQKVNTIEYALPIDDDRSSDCSRRPASSGSQFSQFSQPRLVPLGEGRRNETLAAEENIPSTQQQTRAHVRPGSGDAVLPATLPVLPKKARGNNQRRSLGNPMATMDRNASVPRTTGNSSQQLISKRRASEDGVTKTQPKKHRPATFD